MTHPGGEAGPGNASDRFDRLPQTDDARELEGRPTRREVLAWWRDRYGIGTDTFEPYSFWEKGAGKIWILAGDATEGIRIEALGMRVMHTRQEHWKPTTNAVQRFGHAATRGVIELSPNAAKRFVSGQDQEIEWDGEWGYVVATRAVAGDHEPLGVGLYTYGELKSQIAKGRQRKL